MRPHFPTTHWTLVYNAAGDPLRTQTKSALVDLLRKYTPALAAHLRFKFGVDADDADDLIQGFILEKVIQDQFIRHADERRGRFRSYVLRVFDNFVISQFRKRSTLQSAEEYGLEDNMKHESNKFVGHTGDMFDVAWAHEVLHQTETRMREECLTAKQHVIWQVFEARVLLPIQSGDDPPSYKELVERFDFESPEQATNRVMTARRMFARLLRQVVGEYATDPVEIEEEINEIRRIFSNAGA